MQKFVKIKNFHDYQKLVNLSAKYPTLLMTGAKMNADKYFAAARRVGRVTVGKIEILKGGKMAIESIPAFMLESNAEQISFHGLCEKIKFVGELVINGETASSAWILVNGFKKMLALDALRPEKPIGKIYFDENAPLGMQFIDEDAAAKILSESALTREQFEKAGNNKPAPEMPKKSKVQTEVRFLDHVFKSVSMHELKNRVAHKLVDSLSDIQLDKFFNFEIKREQAEGFSFDPNPVTIKATIFVNEK